MNFPNNIELGWRSSLVYTQMGLTNDYQLVVGVLVRINE